MNNYDSIIEAALEKNIAVGYPERIYEAMAYSVKAGGKRMRPKLMLYTAEGFGGDLEKCLPFAVALEYIHTYSLIHDDLPCMDDDDLRRGVPTNHKVFGEAMALLAGDGLLNLAYEIMAAQCYLETSKESVHAMKEIAVSAGCMGMIGGQVMDILSEGEGADENTLSYIQRNKTGAIIKAAFACGAILSSAPEEKVEKIKEAAEYFGVAFQIRDDLLDVKSSTEILGKPVGSDAKNNKVTYVSLFGLEKAEKDYLDYSMKALEIVKSLSLETGSLEEYMLLLAGRDF